jgi:hypothetical protein
MHLPVISIHNGDHATISNIRYENITVEDAELVPPDSYNPYIIDLWVGQSSWSQDAQRGHINNVSIKNVSVLSGAFGGNRINGCDATHRVSNVTIDNFTVFGKCISNPKDSIAKFNINQYTDSINFICTPNSLSDKGKLSVASGDRLSISLVPVSALRALLVRAPGEFSVEIFSMHGELMHRQYGENDAIVSFARQSAASGVRIVRVKSADGGRLLGTKTLWMP